MLEMENGWYFPSSYEAWQQNFTAETPDIEANLYNSLEADNLLVSQPFEQEHVMLKKKKKRRRNNCYETFHDKYLLSEEILGRGADSLVSVATEKKTQKQYAVKIIVKYEGYDRCRVLREIDLLHFLNDCPNILQLLDSYEDDQRFYLVFERMEGGPLLEHIQRKKCFTEREASLVVNDIATALKFLHDKGIAHRDLKPDNILCVYEDKIVPVVICDFNLASGISMIGSVTTPDLYTPVGSAEYMAPEVVDAFVGDAPAYDKRCDLWSLGVILYIMLSGRPPFEGNCGLDCDWKRGGSCRECQSLLWHNILDANLTYPDDGWANVSLEAKDLISHLLVKEASKRYAVENVLSHPWLVMASDNTLNTPDVLTTDSYSHRLSAVTTEAVAYRRIISERQQVEDGDQLKIITRWSTPPKFGLSPPGHSRLAKRRSLKNQFTAFSLTIENSDSPNNTPLQSPDKPLLPRGGLYKKNSNSSEEESSEGISCRKHGQNSERLIIENEMSNVIQRLKLGLDLSPNEFNIDATTPISTPRNENTSRVFRDQ